MKGGSIQLPTTCVDALSTPKIMTKTDNPHMNFNLHVVKGSRNQLRPTTPTAVTEIMMVSVNLTRSSTRTRMPIRACGISGRNLSDIAAV